VSGQKNSQRCRRVGDESVQRRACGGGGGDQLIIDTHAARLAAVAAAARGRPWKSMTLGFHVTQTN